jgi:dUTP pyrophosphatase
MKLKWKRVHKDAQPPVFSSEGAAAFDLVGIRKSDDTFRTGLAFDIPDGYVVLIFSRSGHGFKESTRLCNAVGVIDSDYTGEIMVKLTRDDGKPLTAQAGESIAQGMLLRLPKVELEEVTELKQTERGEKGFGSTGK